jgi:uncharacterized protein YdhG (YjbR/CyaY superfamily)
MTSPRTKAGDIDEYIRSFPPDVREVLERMRRTVREAAPGAGEAIRYGIPTFRLDGVNLVHFAAFPGHIGFYPTPAAIAAFSRELAPYRQGKGSVQFPLGRPVPWDLVERIVRFRVGETGQSEDRKG